MVEGSFKTVWIHLSTTWATFLTSSFRSEDNIYTLDYFHTCPKEGSTEEGEENGLEDAFATNWNVEDEPMEDGENGFASVWDDEDENVEEVDEDVIALPRFTPAVKVAKKTKK